MFEFHATCPLIHEKLFTNFFCAKNSVPFNESHYEKNSAVPVGNCGICSTITVSAGDCVEPEAEDLVLVHIDGVLTRRAVRGVIVIIRDHDVQHCLTHL